jgi:hypothetical protein
MRLFISNKRQIVRFFEATQIQGFQTISALHQSYSTSQAGVVVAEGAGLLI